MCQNSLKFVTYSQMESDNLSSDTYVNLILTNIVYIVVMVKRF